MSGSAAIDLEDFGDQGIAFPIEVYAADEARGLKARYDAFQTEAVARRGHETFIKPHLISTWLDGVVRHPAILDAVERVLGSDLLLWSADFFMKDAGAGRFVGWHQDAPLWFLEPTGNVVSVWLALTPSTVESGAMRVIPGTHRLGPLAHRSTFDPDNILSDGHEVDWQVPAERAIDVVLQPGQASLHHGDLIHGGMPNKAGYDRVGFVMRYIRPDTVQTMAPDSAMLVRGEDQFGNYLLEPRPESDFHPAAMAALQAALERPSGFNDMVVR